MNNNLLALYMRLYDRRNDSIAEQDAYFDFLRQVGAFTGPLLSDAEVERRYRMVVDHPHLSPAEKDAGLDMLSVFIINRTSDGPIHALLAVITRKQDEYIRMQKPVPQVRPWDVYLQACVSRGAQPNDAEYLSVFGLPVAGAA